MAVPTRWRISARPRPFLTRTDRICPCSLVTNTNVFDGANEYLDADVSKTQLSKSYNPTTGQLTISGVASVATYQQVLRSVYYVDALTSPTVGPRLIDVQAYYGTTCSNTAVCTLSVQRNPNAAPSTTTTHSATAAAASPSVSSSTPTTAHLSQIVTPAQTLTPPYVDLSGGNGGPNWSTWTYGGPSYYAHICPSAIVSYAGTLTSATITLTTHPDGSSEYLAVQTFTLGDLSTQGYNPGTGQLILAGSMDSAVCQALLRPIVYVGLNTRPTTSARSITVKINADLVQSNMPTVTMAVAVALDGAGTVIGTTGPVQGMAASSPATVSQPLQFTQRPISLAPAPTGEDQHTVIGDSPPNTVDPFSEPRQGGSIRAKLMNAIAQGDVGEIKATIQVLKETGQLTEELEQAATLALKTATSTAGKKAGIVIATDIAKAVLQFSKQKLGKQVDAYKNLLKTYNKHLIKYGQKPGKTTGETNRIERQLQQYQRILRDKGKRFTPSNQLIE